MSGSADAREHHAVAVARAQLVSARALLVVTEALAAAEEQLELSRQDVDAHVDDAEQIAKLVGLRLDDGDDVGLVGAVRGVVAERDALREEIARLAESLPTAGKVSPKLRLLLRRATEVRKAASSTRARLDALGSLEPPPS